MKLIFSLAQPCNLQGTLCMPYQLFSPGLASSRNSQKYYLLDLDIIVGNSLNSCWVWTGHIDLKVPGFSKISSKQILTNFSLMFSPSVAVFIFLLFLIFGYFINYMQWKEETLGFCLCRVIYCYGLNCARPLPFMCWNPNTQHLRMWLYSKTGPLTWRLE